MQTNPLLKDLAGKRKLLVDEMRSAVTTAESRSSGPTPADNTNIRQLDLDIASLDQRSAEVSAILKRADEMDPDVMAALDAQRDPASSRSRDNIWLPSRSQFAELKSRAIDNGDAGPLLTAQQSTDFADRLRARSVVMASGVRVVDIADGHATMRIPKVATSTTISMVAEGAAIPQNDATFASVVLEPTKLAALLLASNESLSDTAPALREILAADLTREVATKLDGQFLIGDGTGSNMTGLTAMSGTTSQSLGANGATPTFDDFADALATLEAANVAREDIVAYMAPRTFSTFRKIKDADGRYLTNTVPTADAPASLFGVPVYATTNVPVDQTQGTNDDASTILLLDRSQVVIGRRKQVEISYSEHFAFDADQTAIRLVARYDIQAINAAAIVKIIGVTV